MGDSTVTQEQVNESLNNAIENGYELDKWSAEDVAHDLIMYDSAMEDVAIEKLIPMVTVWKEARANNT